MNDEPQGQIDEEAMSTSEPEVDEEQVALENSKNPERTAAYIQKLKDQNKALAEKNREPQKPSVLEDLYPTPQQPTQFQVGQFDNLNKQQVQEIKDDLTYVGDDGFKYIDQAKLNQKLAEANERADKAVRSAQIASDSVRKYEETQQIRDTYREFPQLNPNGESYDPHFYKMVKNELMSQAWRGEKDLLQAARAVNDTIAVYKGGATKQAETQIQKQQINATTSAQRGRSYSDADDLRRATMEGKPGALAERLKRSGY